MKALIDSTKCSGYGACAETCPSVFEIDEFGFAALLNNGEVPTSDHAKAQAAAEGCPEHAISFQD